MGLFCNIELLPKIKSFLELPIFSPVMTHNRQGGHFCLRYYQYVVLLVGWYDKLIWNLDKYIRQLMKIHLDKYFFQLGQMHFTKGTTIFWDTKGRMWSELSDDTTSCYILISNLDKYIWQLRKIHLAIWTNTFFKLSCLSEFVVEWDNKILHLNQW